MKYRQIYIVIIICTLFFSCASQFIYQSNFVKNPPSLGMDKSSFLAVYGAPFSINSYMDEDGAVCEELVYKEKIDHNGSWLLIGDIRFLNSIFVFKNGKLVSQTQEDDWMYQEQQERKKDRKALMWLTPTSSE